MAVKINLENVKKLSSGIWEGNFQPSEIRLLGLSNNHLEGMNVILLKNAEYLNDKNILSFFPADCVVLNLGSSTKTIILLTSNNGVGNKDYMEKTVNSDAVSLSGGDHQFLRELKDKSLFLFPIGKNFLTYVRKYFRGNLEKSKNGVFVEKPDNFWTIKIQPYDKSFKLTVRGNPNEFIEHRNINILPDRKGYSRFKLTNDSEIPSIVSIIRKASY